MSLSDEQFREQLVDYLYGELEGAPLQAFEAALAEPGRRAELEAMRETLRAARGGLAALSEEPPAGARASILAQAVREEPRVVVKGPWFRKLHAGVVVPALAAAAAVTFAVLAPRRDHVPGENYASEQAPQAEPAPQAQPFPGSPARPEQPADELADERPSLDEAEQSASKGAMPAPRATAPRAGEAKRAAPARARRGSAEGSAGGGRSYGAPPAWDDLREADRGGLGAVREAEPQEERSVQRADKARAQLAADKVASEARAPAPSSAPAPAKKDAPKAEQGPAAASSASPAGAAADGTTAPAALVEKAREHANAHRWADAAIAYRELLQRYPRDPRAASWRSELGRVARELSAVPLLP